MTYVGATNFKIKDWFLNKMESPRRHFTIIMGVNDMLPILRETEKAVLCLVQLERVDGEQSSSAEVWVPKSCLEDRAEYLANEKAREERRAKAFEEGKARYEKLFAFAVESGLKIRKRSTTETIMKAIKEAGLSYNG